MRQRIIAVDNDSIAEELGIKPGFFLLRINGEDVEDVIDYEQLTAETHVTLELETKSGKIVTAEVDKEEYEPLGIYFESGLMSKVRSCKNKCVFCFIDQMPKGGRDTLHFKDDDWRLSLIMGNYVSLTNVDDKEFDRMLRRRVRPAVCFYPCYGRRSAYAHDGKSFRRAHNGTAYGAEGVRSLLSWADSCMSRP